MKKIFLVISSVLLIFSAIFAACTGKNQTSEDKDQAITYIETPVVTNSETPNEQDETIEDSSLKNNCGQSYYFCGYRTYIPDFNNNSVKLNFYYGSLRDVASNSYPDGILDNMNLILKFCDTTYFDSDFIRIKEISGKEFYSDKYTIIPDKLICEYYCSAEITIPEKYFKYDCGGMLLSLYEEFLLPTGEVKLGAGCRIDVYYKKEGNKIILSNKSFQGVDL